MSEPKPVESSHIAIVGAGPIGLELAAAFKRLGVPYIHFEARQIGYTMSWWPRQTLFFSTTERIEIAGIPLQNTSQQRASGEEYLAYLRSIVELLDLQIQTYEPVIEIRKESGGFSLLTQPQTGTRRYFVGKVILAIGDMHAPNRLGIPGEDLAHVSHYFDDPHRYFRKRLMIVGGRNSAAEAALRCWRAGSRVSISYRRSDFDPQTVKHWILPDLKTQIELGTIQFYPQTIPIEITPGFVRLACLNEEGAASGEINAPADFVLLHTGFVQDSTLFDQAGIHLSGEQRVPQFDPETMETNVPGLYLAGTAAAGSQRRYTLFIENTHVHVGKIVKALTGIWPAQLGTIPERHYELPLDQIQAN